MEEVPGGLYVHLQKRMRSKRDSHIGFIPRVILAYSRLSVSGDDWKSGRTIRPRSSPLTESLKQGTVIPAEVFLESRDGISFSADTVTTLDIFVYDENACKADWIVHRAPPGNFKIDKDLK